ncbi:MAG TPA: acyltransferase family protein [Acidimicrobiales bacterium]|nr:acyltransferase family protein [Acidimicrobiales bacterium]
MDDPPAPARPAAPAGPAGPRLAHEPALDGLRGLAVAAVVAFHLGHLTGGFLGVDLFFVLSGYLITSLLLVEHGGGGRIDLGRFWSRRARRLLPALFLLLVGVAVLIFRFTPAGERPGLRGDALSTLGYVANWHALFDKLGYWDMFAQPSPLDHMWSLAIEEQFYLVWPLVVVGLLALARRRSRPGTRSGLGARTVAGVALAGAAASFVVLAVTFVPDDTNRAYFATDSRVGPTLLGAALAAVTVSRRRRGAGTAGAVGDGVPPVTGGRGPTRTTPARLAAGTAALVALVVGFVVVDGTASAYYRGGLVAFALAAVVLIHLVTGGRGGVLARLLAWRPLAALGVISYGVYLWHWPAIVYLVPARARIDGWALDALRVAVTLACAVVSYLAVERPIRRGALRGRPVRLALVGSVAVTAVAVVAGTAGTSRPPTVTVAGVSSEVPQAAGALAEREGDAGNPYRYYPAAIPEGAPRILLVGDSGPMFLVPALAAEAQRAGAVVASDSQFGCTPLAPEGVARWGDRIVETEPCHDQRRAGWADLVEQFDPDVVVYYLAAISGLTDVKLDGDWVGDCDAAYDGYLVEALEGDLDVLTGTGAQVLLATSPLAPIAGINATGPDAVVCRADTYRVIAGDRSDTAVIDMAGVVAAGAGEDHIGMFGDPVHLSPEGAAYVAAWMVPEALTALSS